MKDAPIKALAPWFGAKRTMASTIVNALGEHDFFFSGFLGGAPVELLNDKPKMQVWNDLNADMHNLIRVFQSPADRAELEDRLRYTFAEERQFRESKGKFEYAPFQKGCNDVEHAFHSLCYWWLGMNGYAGLETKSNTGYARRYGPGGGSQAARWNSLKESIPYFAERLRTVDIWNIDIRKALPKIQDRPGTAIYLDPPYVVKSDRYKFDFAPIGDDQDKAEAEGRMTHRCLARMADQFERARVVISYYDHPALRELYPAGRWEWIECSTRKNLGNSSGAASVAPEVLLVNRRAV